MMNLDYVMSNSSIVLLTRFKTTALAALKGDTVFCYFPNADRKYTRPYQGLSIEESLHKFQTEGGVLVTDGDGFTGVEATAVVDIGSQWRDTVMRATTQVAVIDHHTQALYYDDCKHAGATDGQKIEKVIIP